MKNSELVSDCISKKYNKVEVLSCVSFRLQMNATTGLVGGNGAGKSTLLQIMAGALNSDAGELSCAGDPYTNSGVSTARSLGIHMVFQDCALCPDGTVMDNLFLGSEPCSKFGLVRSGVMKKQTKRLIEKYQLPLPDINIRVSNLSGGQKKAVAIGRALLASPRYLLLDEPMAALGVRERSVVMGILKGLQNQGIGMFLCSHSPEEILELSHRVLALRRGKICSDIMTDSLEQTELALLMSS